jgi:hypothetical protein
MFAGVNVVVIVVMFAGVIPSIVVLAVGSLLLGTLIVRGRHNRTMLQSAAERVAWGATKLKGEHIYRSGPLGRTPGATCTLPGVAAATRVSEHEDVYGRPFALLEWPSTKHFTVVLTSEPDGASLVDPDQVDQWVAHYGQFLDQLCDEPGLVQASVTIETAPDSGARLRRELARQTDPEAHPLAREMMEEVADTYPAGSANVRAMTALTFTGSGRRIGSPRPREQVARDLAYRVHAFTNLLEKAGAGATRPMSQQALAEVVLTAYDPLSAAAFEQARVDGEPADVGWDDVGPQAAEARWDSYRHDSGISVTWAVTQAPRGEITSDVLSQLLKPHRDIDRKRVTLLYRPLDRGHAARVVESDKRNADFRANKPRPSSREQNDQKSAHTTAAEEAKGAGLVDCGMLVTATVTDYVALIQARHAVEQIAPTARVQLRPVFGSQDSAFVACLPVGLVTDAHLRTPGSVREAL